MNIFSGLSLRGMPLFTTSLNSGSNGNCYYISNECEAILVDAGIPCREIEKRMKRLCLPVQKIKAVFITHEHTDHIHGVAKLSHKYQIPVYITPATLHQSRLCLDAYLVRTFCAFEPVSIGGLCVHAFPKLHDAVDPHSFVIAGNGVKIGVFTDIGWPCAHLTRYFSECNAAFLEANYDEEMLECGKYPYHLKKRISGQNGHLSNRQALELFMEHKPSFMNHIILSHLSKENNRPELVYDLFVKQSGNTKVTIASRYEETALFTIHPNQEIPANNRLLEKRTLIQSSLF